MTIGRIPSVEGGIQPTIFTTKGDILVATANATVTRQGVGSDDQVLVADSTQADGIAWKSYGAQFVAGKNKIINGDFGVWQRGTTFNNATIGTYTADRWFTGNAESTGSNITRSTFTPATAPVAGYEGQYFLTFVKGGTTSDKMGLVQRIEDVRTFAGQTVTISYWMKGSANFTNEPLVQQNFGSGGSSEVYTTTATQSITTSWARYSVTVTVPSISGKTVGTSSFIGFWPLRYVGTSNITADIWGVQVEAGSVATPFTTATGTIQGELAACQRYYFRFTGPNAYSAYGIGYSQSTTDGSIDLPFPVPMRIVPTSIDYANVAVQQAGGSVRAINTLTIDQSSLKGANLNFIVTAGATTANVPCRFLNNNNAAGYVGLNAEL